MIKTSVSPTAIAEVILQHDHWDTPKQIIRDVFQPNARVAVKACHASSKTFTAADCILVALLLGGDVLTTASSWEQVQSVMWAQVHRAIADSVIPYREWGQINLTEITMATGEKALGLSTNEYTRFQGWHSRPDSFLLVIVDEATGVRPDIFKAIEGIAAGGDVREMELANPTEPSGQFFDIFNNQSPVWKRYTIDAFDTPNLAGISLERLLEMSDTELDDNARPYLVTRRWVRDRFYEWGVDHPEWQARVRGEFPQNADISLIWRSWIEDAKAKEAHYANDGGYLTAGIDVAGPGEDETVCYVRQGANLLDEAKFPEPDPRGAVLAFLRRFIHEGLSTVNVDSAGIGWNFYLHIKDNLPESVQVNPVNVGESPSTDASKEKNLNLRAELYRGLRERFQGGEIAGITDATLISQLAGIRYKHDSRGRVVIESKDDARKRGVKSPDRADALMLCFAPQLRGQRLAGAFQAAAKRREW